VSDLIIARAGSGLIFEIAASGKPSILIPLPWASRGHQKRNAYEYAKNEATVVIEEGNLKPNVFSDLIIQIVSDKKKKEKMSQAALEFSKPKAAYDIAQHLLQIV
ncbi:MAG TPA: glycosyltransferase, partial [Candidatus Paceibacterota bacterium]|nr:glycosyltransferase [Candidatus Paceibacterota bacterium]